MCCRGAQRPRYDYKSIKQLTQEHEAETDTQKAALDQSRENLKNEMACTVPKDLF